MTTTTLDPDLLDRAARRYHDLGADAWPDATLVGVRRRPGPGPACRPGRLVRAPRAAGAARPDRAPPLGRARRASAPRSCGCSRCSTSSSRGTEAGLPAPVADARPDAPSAARGLAAALAAGDLEAADVEAARVAHAAAPGELASLLGARCSRTSRPPRTRRSSCTTCRASRPVARRRRSSSDPSPASSRATRASASSGCTTARRPAARPAALEDALGEVPALGVPESTFIFPLMHQVDRTGVARELLAVPGAGVTPAAAARVLLRAAARAMLLADPDHAPYGWSHCLTMPQAALGIAAHGVDPQLAVDVAGHLRRRVPRRAGHRAVARHRRAARARRHVRRRGRRGPRRGGGLGAPRARRRDPGRRGPTLDHPGVRAPRRPPREVHARLPRRVARRSRARAGCSSPAPRRCSRSGRRSPRPRSVGRSTQGAA